MSRSCIILTPEQIRESLTLSIELHDLIEAGFLALKTESCVMPSVLGMTLDDRHGEVDVKTAYWPSKDYFAIKISPGFFNNPTLGLPSLNGLMVLLSSVTGRTAALLIDNGYLTDLRTAAAGGVVARHLAPNKSSLGIVGAGVQARLQLQSFRIEREVTDINLWARDLSKTELFAQEIRDQYGYPVRVCKSVEELTRSSQSIITTTPSREPLIQGEWLQAGQHLTAMGSDAPEKRELSDTVLERATRIVVDRLEQSQSRGELRPYAGAKELPVTELPDLIASKQTRDAGEITVADLTGTGIQDTAIANYLFEQLEARSDLLRVDL